MTKAAEWQRPRGSFTQAGMYSSASLQQARRRGRSSAPQCCVFSGKLRLHERFPTRRRTLSPCIAALGTSAKNNHGGSLMAVGGPQCCKSDMHHRRKATHGPCRLSMEKTDLRGREGSLMATPAAVLPGHCTPTSSNRIKKPNSLAFTLPLPPALRWPFRTFLLPRTRPRRCWRRSGPSASRQIFRYRPWESALAARRVQT